MVAREDFFERVWELVAEIPCGHRVIASDGSCAPCWPEQKMLLLREGVSFLPNGKADLAHYRWEGL